MHTRRGEEGRGGRGKSLHFTNTPHSYSNMEARWGGGGESGGGRGEEEEEEEEEKEEEEEEKEETLFLPPSFPSHEECLPLRPGEIGVESKT